MELEQEAKRLENGTVFLPKHYWDWIEVENGGVFTIGLDKGKHGKYIALYAKEETQNENTKTIPEGI